jgi:hypothetical protein
MAASFVGETRRHHRNPMIILPIDMKYDIYSPDEFEFA